MAGIFIGAESDGYVADADYPVAIGYAASAGERSIAIGYNASADGYDRIAIGYAAAPPSDSTCYIGQPTTNPIALKAASYTDYSDRKLKKNIKELTNGLDIIMDLNPVEFYFKSDSGNSTLKKKRLGLIAQEVQEVANKHVDNWGAVGQDPDCWSLDYNQIIAPLIGAIKEQQAQIDDLKKEIENLNKIHLHKSKLF